MTKDEALDLALDYIVATNKSSQFWLVPESNLNKTVTAIKQARALDKKAENARELGLDYEPDYKVTVVDDHHPNGVPLEQWGRVAKQGEHMRQRIEDLISAMEYHVEQTRPVHSTTIALQAAREALKAMPTPLVCDCNQGQVCHVCDPITPPAQPAPAPLTDAQRRAIIAKLSEADYADGDEWDNALFDAIEAAHGITSQASEKSQP